MTKTKREPRHQIFSHACPEVGAKLLKAPWTARAIFGEHAPCIVFEMVEGEHFGAIEARIFCGASYDREAGSTVPFFLWSVWSYRDGSDSHDLRHKESCDDLATAYAHLMTVVKALRALPVPKPGGEIGTEAFHAPFNTLREQRRRIVLADEATQIVTLEEDHWRDYATERFTTKHGMTPEQAIAAQQEAA